MPDGGGAVPTWNAIWKARQIACIDDVCPCSSEHGMPAWRSWVMDRGSPFRVVKKLVSWP
jgi:hypothetical protein